MTDIVKNFGRKEGFKDISAFEKDVQAAIEEASGKFQNIGKSYYEEKDRADELDKLCKELKIHNAEITKESNKNRRNLINYQEKNRFIDLDKTYAQAQRAMSEADVARKEAAGYKKDLLDIRNRILELTQKADKKNKKKKKKQQDEEWHGAEDVELICAMFTSFLAGDPAIVKQQEAKNASKVVKKKPPVNDTKGN